MTNPKIIASTWTVLVVDDEPDSIEVVSDTLEFYGAKVHRASDGKEATAKLEHLRPTFILSDLSMPEMDGWALLSHIRKKPELADIPVVALTAHAMKGDAQRVLAAGFAAHLPKPLSPFTLIEDILRALPVSARQAQRRAHVSMRNIITERRNNNNG